jgi:hypothetical protein
MTLNSSGVRGDLFREKKVVEAFPEVAEFAG